MSACSSLPAPKVLPAPLVALFAIAAGVSVANVYYAQPLLDALAHDFQINRADVGGVITATQTGWALTLLLLSWLPLAALPHSVLLLGAGIVLLDLAAQAVHVTNQSLILRAPPALHGRLIGGYMLFYAAGSGIGAILTTRLYSWGGWTAVCMAGAAISALALLLWASGRGQTKV